MMTDTDGAVSAGSLSESSTPDRARPLAAPTGATCDYCHGVGACPRCWGRSAIEELTAERAALVDALRDLLGATSITELGVPSENAPCHAGICEQKRCGHCGRLMEVRRAAALARALLAGLDGGAR